MIKSLSLYRACSALLSDSFFYSNWEALSQYQRDISLKRRKRSVAYKWESEEQGNCFYFFSNSFDKVICPNLFKCCRFTRSNQGIVG